MNSLWDSIKRGYLRLIEPVADYLARHRVNPNVITTIGTLCTIAAAVIYAFGHISIAGWVLGLTALFDVLDGTVEHVEERRESEDPARDADVAEGVDHGRRDRAQGTDRRDDVRIHAVAGEVVCN